MMIRELFTNHWKAPLLDLVLAWVCGIVAISSFCMCGYMRYSRLTGAILAIVLGAVFLLVFPAVIVSIIHQVRARDWAGLAIALILFALAALADLMWAMGVGMLAYNPGEPGQVLLRAYEVTTGKCAFGREVELKSESGNAWSVDRMEKFRYYHPHLHVFLRGRENVFYAVRFEVWFKPSSGQPERKLIERVYRVCGHAHCG